MRIFGADACKDRLVLCCLEALPSDPREDFLDAEFEQVSTNTLGLKQFLDLEPDVVVLEPTGMHYIKFWLHHLEENGVEVRLVHNTRLPKFRSEILDIPDKDDEADAYSLALYYWHYNDNPARWVTVRDSVVQRMREIHFKLSHNARITTAIINRLHQVLSHEFPEAAKKTINAPLFWGWVAGERKSQRYDLMLENSKGLGISEPTRFDAGALYHYILEDDRLEAELKEIYCNDSRFDPYRQVFDQFGFGLRCSALILSQIYPLEDFLGKDGKPIVKRTKGRYSKKKTKKYLSLRRFRKALGDAPTREWSGNSKKSKKSGSQLCRTALWQWINRRIVTRVSNAALKTELGEKYRKLYHDGKVKKQVDQKLRASIRHQVVEDLFYSLINAIIR